MATRALDLNRSQLRGPARTSPRAVPRQPTTTRERADLRVAPRPRTAARRRRLLLTVVTTLTVVLAFGVAASQVVVAQNQAKIDNLDQRANAAQIRHDKLRFKVAELESPERIVDAAKNKLGMVEPAHVTYVAPPSDTPKSTDENAGK